MRARAGDSGRRPYGRGAERAAATGRRRAERAAQAPRATPAGPRSRPRRRCARSSGAALCPRAAVAAAVRSLPRLRPASVTPCGLAPARPLRSCYAPDVAACCGAGQPLAQPAGAPAVGGGGFGPVVAVPVGGSLASVLPGVEAVPAAAALAPVVAVAAVVDGGTAPWPLPAPLPAAARPGAYNVPHRRSLCALLTARSRGPAGARAGGAGVRSARAGCSRKRRLLKWRRCEWPRRSGRRSRSRADEAALRGRAAARRLCARA